MNRFNQASIICAGSQGRLSQAEAQVVVCHVSGGDLYLCLAMEWGSVALLAPGRLWVLSS